jgi:hypothetical protein
MIKVYFDWNVMSQMKHGNHQELYEIVKNNKFLFKPFSTSHIGDIFSSFKDSEEQLAYINSDLDFITELTENYCFYNSGDKTILNYYNPKELFQQRVDEKELFKDISLNGLEKFFNENELTKEIGKIYIDQLKSIPLDKTFIDSFKNPESSEEMEKMFPGLKDNLTMEGFFKAFSNMNLGLNESDDYKTLRVQMQSALNINRDSIFNSKDPYKHIDDIYQKLGISSSEHFTKSKYSPEWFNEITNEYISLDMHGYQEDKVNIKKGRKETFSNTTEDSFHAAYASICNFYIINDNKSYNKCKRIYEKLDVKTIVLKPNEFVEYYNKYLKKEDFSSDLNLAIEIIKSENFVEDEVENGLLRTYVFPYRIFDFFNKILILFSTEEDNEKPTILLSQQSSKFTKVYSFELTNLIKSLIELYGIDIDNYGEFNEEEMKPENWIGRKWNYSNIVLRLTKINGHFQLYLEI